MSRQALRDLRWWTRLHESLGGHSGAIWQSPTTVTLHTDAAHEGLRAGWGGVLNHELQARGNFPIEEARTRHINEFELLAVKLTIETFLEQCAHKVVKLYTDSQVVEHILVNMTSRSRSLMKELRRLLWLTFEHNIKLEPEYIRSQDNVLADRLSRTITNDDWQLHPRWLQHYQD